MKDTKKYYMITSRYGEFDEFYLINKGEIKAKDRREIIFYEMNDLFNTVVKNPDSYQLIKELELPVGYEAADMDHPRGYRTNTAIITKSFKLDNLGTIKYLVKNHINISSSKDAMLTWAVKINNIDIVKYLIELGISVDYATLHTAVEYSNDDIVYYLFDRCPKVPASSIVSAAVRGGKIELLRHLFIEKGLYVNPTDLNDIMCGITDLEVLEFLKSVYADMVFKRDKTYYKITNKEETHHNYKYHTGFNTDPNPWSARNCSPGGFYFSDVENVLRWLMYGNVVGYYIRKVTVPKYAKVNVEGSKFKCNYIILGRRRRLGKLSTIKYLEKNHLINDITICKVIKWAIKTDNFRIFKYLHKKKYITSDMRKDISIDTAIFEDRPRFLKYIIESKMDDFDMEKIVDMGISYESTNTLKYIVEYLKANPSLIDDLIHSKLTSPNVIEYMLTHSINIFSSKLGFRRFITTLCDNTDLAPLVYLLEKGIIDRSYFDENMLDMIKSNGCGETTQRCLELLGEERNEQL